MERDVIVHKPQLVVVMFGMNDVVRTEAAKFRAKLQTIVRRCRSADSAVLLCTPNSVYPNPTRPMERLAQYAQIVRDVAKEMSVCLADCFAAYEEVRRNDVTRWRLLMSETIHPGMNGHKLFAEVIAERISGRGVSLAGEEPPAEALSFTLKRLGEKQPLNVIAMPPFDRIVPEALRGLIEEFVTRQGTDYGVVEASFERKLDDVMRQLENGEARIVFDAEEERANIVPVG